MRTYGQSGDPKKGPGLSRRARGRVPSAGTQCRPSKTNKLKFASWSSNVPVPYAHVFDNPESVFRSSPLWNV
jgi:hypothetical protein